MQPEDKDKERKQCEERILFGSSPEPKTFRLDTNRCQFNLEELSNHRYSYSENTTQKSEFFGLLGVIVVGFIIAVVGTVALFWLWPAYAHSIAVIPGATVVFFGGGILFLIGGPIIVLSGLYDFFFGSKLATVEEAANRTFIAESHKLLAFNNLLFLLGHYNLFATSFLKRGMRGVVPSFLYVSR